MDFLGTMSCSHDPSAEWERSSADHIGVAPFPLRYRLTSVGTAENYIYPIVWLESIYISILIFDLPNLTLLVCCYPVYYVVVLP
ncbi:hypothetical protein GDO78_008822 [Eleutherodactylus coqui]|uniref:Uncharacterized protein n=1 Tax=Eleutherodactylus coqui TaxID=57060 RepID=A0A8J6FEB1_ELECQ|nr:hypothetical protein GDO78_008822 [Eleutherodactylus coqui]